MTNSAKKHSPEANHTPYPARAPQQQDRKDAPSQGEAKNFHVLPKDGASTDSAHSEPETVQHTASTDGTPLVRDVDAGSLGSNVEGTGNDRQVTDQDIRAAQYPSSGD